MYKPDHVKHPFLSAALKPFHALAAVASLTAICTAPALAEVPMWIIEDENSTIYITGTVHMLPPELKWNGPKLDKALDDATELWLEVPMAGSMQEMQASVAPIMMQYALSPNKTLSSRLNEEEQAQLKAALERADLPPGTAQGIEIMKPWVVTQMLGLAPLLAAGYDAEAGIDMQLVNMARDQDDEILGFETMEQQLTMFANTPEDQQMEALRATLATTPEEIEAMTTDAKTAFEAWANGDVSALDTFITEWKSTGDTGAYASTPYETLIVNRNKDWAQQIDDMLSRSGTHFIAVGGGHLVGPDSVQEQLKQRGIEAKRH